MNHKKIIFACIIALSALIQPSKLLTSTVNIENYSSMSNENCSDSFYDDDICTSEPARPDFLIIGVAKCGTTSLYDYLMHHPQIEGAEKKELYFFNREADYSKGIEFYNKKFPPKKPGVLTGEASPRYLTYARCPERILRHCPHAKLIIILRDPVARAISFYHFYKNRPFFIEQLKGAKNFDEAIKTLDATNDLFDEGDYLKYIKKWLEFFPRKQILIVFLEDLMRSPKKELNRVFRFLGVKKHTLGSYPVRNKTEYDASTISHETIEYLQNFYAPHNAKLKTFLGRKLPWKKWDS